MYYTPLTGDDLGYLATFSGPHPKYAPEEFPRYVWAHWLNSNGRIGNYLLPPLLAMPRAVYSLLCAGMLALMLWVSVLWSGRREGLLPQLLIAAIMIVMPWWDSLWMYATQLNYVWPSAWAFLATWMIMYARPKGWKLAAATLFCLIGGMMHEACSVAFCFGFVCYFAARGRWPDKPALIMLSAFALGTLETLGPGLLSRTEAAPDADPLTVLLSGSLPVIILLLSMLIALCLRGGRQSVNRLMSSPAGVLVYAAVAGMAISLYSGIPGRSGWYASLSALIVLTHWAGTNWKPKAPLLRALIGGMLAAWLLLIAYEQRRLYAESEEFIALYVASPSGTIFMDYTRDSQLPPLAMRRLRNVPDPDDKYLLESYRKFYGKSHIPVILPGEARNHLPLTQACVPLTCGDTLYLSAQAETDRRAVQPIPEGGYHVSLRQRDPGDPAIP